MNKQEQVTVFFTTHYMEEAFLALIGKAIREEEASPLDRMRLRRVAWRGGRR